MKTLTVKTKSRSKTRQVITIGATVAVAGLAIIQPASAGFVTDAIAGSTTSADITEAGGFVIGLAVLAMGINWTKATFF